MKLPLEVLAALAETRRGGLFIPVTQSAYDAGDISGGDEATRGQSAHLRASQLVQQVGDHDKASCCGILESLQHALDSLYQYRLTLGVKRKYDCAGMRHDKETLTTPQQGLRFLATQHV